MSFMISHKYSLSQIVNVLMNAMQCRGRITRHTTSEHTVCARFRVILRSRFFIAPLSRPSGPYAYKTKTPVASAGVLRGFKSFNQRQNTFNCI